MSNKYKEYLEAMNARNKELTCDELGDDAVEILHQDGSNIHLRNAMFEEVDDYIMVYAEHFAPMLFYKDDLIEYRMVEI